MNSDVRIEAVMSVFPHTVDYNGSLRVAQEAMREYGIHHLPVRKDGALVGILSHRDLLFGQMMQKKLDIGLTIGEICTEEPYTVAPSTPLRRVTQKMAEDQIGCTLVADNDRLMGIFTTVDACRTLTELLQGPYDT